MNCTVASIVTERARRMSDVTQILSQIESGDPHATERLMPLVYEELRKLAAARLGREPLGQTLQTTALVHEAYVRLVDVKHTQNWDSRGHFFAAAAKAMRRILIDAARKKRSQRRGGAQRRHDLLEGDLVALPISDELLDLDAALDELARIDPPAAELVNLRVFAGMTVAEAAQLQGVSERTAKRRWSYARAWLGRQLAAPPEGKS
jgi:RNA polymerase sigma factor (TIGR02999 family)